MFQSGGRDDNSKRGSDIRRKLRDVRLPLEGNKMTMRKLGMHSLGAETSSNDGLEAHCAVFYGTVFQE
jgi:hypothetical protein